MSAYSQPLGSISHSQHSNSESHPYKPKYTQENSSSQRNSFPENKPNRLPLNLFMSATQYNKMLITCGKNRKRPVSHLNEGFGTNLEYVNDHIFQKLNQERALARQNVPIQLKSTKKQHDECTCCCCQQFCQQCANQKHNCKKLSQSQIKKALITIDNEIALARKGVKASLNKSHKRIENTTQIYQSRRAKSAVSDSRSNNTRQTQSQMAVDISHLVIKSLIQFQENKKRQAFLKESRKNTQKAKEEYLHLLNNKIRQQNFETSQHSHQKPKAKSLSKSQISTKYWNQVKPEVFNNLKNDNYSATLKKQLSNYQFQVFENNEVPKRQVKLTKAQIEQLRVKHQFQAKKIIEEQMREKQQKSKKIKQELQLVEMSRIQHIRSIPQKKFIPTEQMINEAFKNVVEPKKPNIVVDIPSTTVKNHGLKKHTKNEHLKNKKELKSR